MKDKLTESLHEDIADLQARKRLLSREVSSLSAVRAAGRHVFRRGAAMMLLRRRARQGPATAGGVGTHGDPMRWLFVAGARQPVQPGGRRSRRRSRRRATWQPPREGGRRHARAAQAGAHAVS
jgi:hypothetical protein